MPWQASDAGKHVQGLTAHQATVWARVANAALRSCRADGRSAKECEGTALRQAAAVAQRAPKKAIKADTAALDGRLSILAIPFGGPLEGSDGQGRDTDGEFFSDRTNLALDWFPNERPLLWHHGLDADPGIAVVGRVDVGTAEKTEEGWWVAAQLDRHHAYFKDLLKLLDEDALFASSGAMPHLVKVASDGEVLRWPWVELSLTPTPANLFATVTAPQAKAHYKAAGLALPDTKDDAGDQEAPPSYSETLERLTDELPEFVTLSRHLAEQRSKVGRSLSRARRDRLGALLRAMQEGASALDALLRETEPTAHAEHEDVPADTSTPARKGSTASGSPAPELVSVFRDFQEFTRFYERVPDPTGAR